jgi:hypothetical protein
LVEDGEVGGESGGGAELAEEAAGGESALDEGGDAVDEGAGFPRPGTGDYKEGPVGVGGGVGLGGIEGRSVPDRGR